MMTRVGDKDLGFGEDIVLLFGVVLAFRYLQKEGQPHIPSCSGFRGHLRFAILVLVCVRLCLV